MKWQGEIIVEPLKIAIEQKLNELSTLTSSDFSALACLNEQDQTIHWNHVYGNMNNRYKQMIGKPGKGIAGSVIRFGRVIIIDQDTVGYDKIRLEYPIMLAENLRVAIAVPVYSNGKIRSVLVTGMRSNHKYTVEQINQVKETAAHFTSLLLTSNIANY